MEKIDDKIDIIIAKLQQVLEKNLIQNKELSVLKTKNLEIEAKNSELAKNISRFENQLKEGNSSLVSGLTEKERVEVKKKIKSYISEIDGFLSKTTV